MLRVSGSGPIILFSNLNSQEHHLDVLMISWDVLVLSVVKRCSYSFSIGGVEGSSLEMDLFIFATLLTLLLGLMLKSFLRMRREMARLPPGPLPLPLIGSLWKMDLKNAIKSLKKMNETYGDIFTIYQGHQPFVVLCGYRAIKETLIEQAEAFSGRGPFPLIYNFTKGDGGSFTNGEKWRQLRRFQITTLRNFGMGKQSIEERIKEEAMNLVTVIKEKNGSPIDINDCLPQSVSNVICSIVFGHRFDYSDKNFQRLLKCIQDNFKIMSSPWGLLYNVYSDVMDYIPGPHKVLMTNFKMVTDFVREIMEEKKKTLDHNHPQDYIDCFLIKIEKERSNFNTYFNHTSLVMTTMLLFLGGSETISTTLTFGFLLLMKYPNVAGKVQKEIDDVIGQDRLPNWEDKARMPYMEAFIHEVQRYANVIPLGVPHQLTMDTQIRDFKFPKGTNFIPFLTSVHHDKTWFRNPENFEPGNFLDENGKFMKSNAFVAFSAGKRICPGETLAVMELFLYFTIILQNFTVISLVPPEEISTDPCGVGFGSVAPAYEICLLPR